MSKIKSKTRSEGQITYISGLRMSKAVLTNYRNGRYSDEMFIKHLVKYNEGRSDMFVLGNDQRTYEEQLRAQYKYFYTRHKDATNADKADAILAGARAISNWQDENDAYKASLEETYSQIPDSVKRKIKRKFGTIDWDSAVYDTENKNVVVERVDEKNTHVLTMSINSHKAGDYDEATLQWQVTSRKN